MMLEVKGMGLSIDIGNYCGICREVIYIAPASVIVRFNALGNDEIDLEFKKEYPDRIELVNSIKDYLENTTKPTKEERGPTDNDWKDFERKVNASVVQLFRDAVNGTIYLPDNGAGYKLKNNIEMLRSNIEKFDKGEGIQYVTYRL